MLRISVIICTYNRAPHVVRTLESLAVQTLRRECFEIVVVDNNSNDDTRERVMQFIEHNPGLDTKLISEIRQGLSYARNAGIAASKGDILVMIDDDEMVNPEFLKSYLAFFERNRDAAAAGGVMIPLYEYELPRWVSKYPEQMLSSKLCLGSRQMEFPRRKFPIGGNMAFRREVFNKSGNFNTSLGRKGEQLLGGEEKDLFMRIRAAGEKIYYLPDAVVYHIIPESRFTFEHLDKLSLMVGRSEKIRSQAEGGRAYAASVFREALKWKATILLAKLYIIKGRPEQASALIRMRKGVTQGLLGKSS